MKEKTRVYSFDFLRSAAMLLGFAVHAPLIFYFPGVASDFGIKDIEPPENWILLMLDFITIWRMPIFYLLSGFFSIMIIIKIGLKSYTIDRFIRIGLTCLFFSALFDILDGNLDFTLSHLWFLYYLFIFIVGFSFLYLFRGFRAIISKKITVLRWIVILLLLIMIGQLAVLINGSLSPLDFSPPETYFDIDFAALAYYFPFYLLGTLLYSNQHLFQVLESKRLMIVIGLLSIFFFTLFLYLNNLMLVDIFQHAELNPILVILNNVLKQLNTITWIIFLMSFSTRYIKSNHPSLKWFVELSYPLYILHLAPVTVISAELYIIGLNQMSIFIVTILIGFFITVVLYYTTIKFTPINWLVNGYRKSFFKI
ncbi:MAG: acyltransferase family protein [Hyphomicrobiales bacterium]